MKIKHIIIILFIVLSVLPMTVMGTANMYYNNAKLEEVMENDLRNTANIQMKAIENFLTERRADAENIVGNPLVDYVLRGEGASASAVAEVAVGFVNDVLAMQVESNEYIDSVTIVDKDFVVAACSEAWAVGSESALKKLDSRYLTPRLIFTPVMEVMRDGEKTRIIAMVMELYVAERMEGYLVMELNLDFFDEIRDSAKVYNNGTIYIVDGNGALISAGDTVAARDEFVLTQEEQADYHRAWDARDKSASSGILRYKAKGYHYVTYYSSFEDIDWTIQSSVNMDELLQRRKSYIELIILIATVLACLLVAVNYIVRKFLGTPIGEMIEKFKYIERTRDYSVRMKTAGSHEISAVSGSINSLLVGMERHVQREHEIKEELRKKAERDPLTGLYNKEAFGRRLDAELEKAARRKGRLACLFLDIDDFKDFNTKYGHSGGDEVLVFIAEALRSQVGELACRQGGDEFTVCVPDASDAELIKSMAEDLIQFLHHGLRIDGRSGLMPINCSIGIVFSDAATATAAQLIERADKAMYEVKADSKNGCRVWEDGAVD